MSNTKQNTINLREFIANNFNPKDQKDFFDLTSEIVVEQSRRRGFNTNFKEVDPDKPWYSHVSDFYDEMVNQAADETIPGVVGAGKRIISSFKREADKDLNYDSSSIKQGVENIDGNDPNLPFLRKYFSMYGKVCYNMLVATEAQEFKREIYTDPGVYCLDYSISSKIKVWTNKYSEKVSRLLLKAEKKENSKELKASVLRVVFDNFIENMNTLEIVSKNQLMVTDQVKDSLIEQISSLDVDNDFNSQYFFGGCVLLFEPVYIVSKKLSSSGGILSSQALKETIVEAVGLEIPGDQVGPLNSFLDYSFPMKITKMFKNNKFRKSWYAYTMNFTYDPQGKKSYDKFWKQQPFKVQQKGNLGGRPDAAVYELGVSLYTAFTVGLIVDKLVVTTIDKLQRLRKKAGKAKNPIIRAGFITAGMTATSLYSIIDPQNIFDVKLQAAESIDRIIRTHLDVFFNVYRKHSDELNDESNVDKSIIIDHAALSKAEKDVNEAAQLLVMQLDEIMRTILQHGMEEDRLDMPKKRELEQVLSGLIEMVHTSFHGSNIDFTIPGKGKNDQVTQQEIYDKMVELRETISGLQVLNRLIKGEYGSNEKARKIKQSELVYLKHLSKKNYNKIDGSYMGQMLDMADAIRYNRSILFGTVFRKPDYDKKPDANESIFYPKEISTVLSNSNSESILEQQSESVDFRKEFGQLINKVKGEIDFWKPAIEQVFGTAAGKALVQEEDSDKVEKTQLTSSEDIEIILKNTLVPELRMIKDKVKKPTRSALSLATSEFNEWYNRVYMQDSPRANDYKQITSGGILDKDGKLKKELRFGILNSDYFNSLPGLKSRYPVPSADEGPSKYMYLVIGLINGTSNTMMRILDSSEAKQTFKAYSEIQSLGSSQAAVRELPNGYEILNVQKLMGTNPFALFTKEKYDVFFERFKKTRQIFNELEPFSQKVPKKHNSNQDTETDRKILDILRGVAIDMHKNSPNTVSDNSHIFSGFYLLNTFLESLGILFAWSYVFSMYTNKNYSRLKAVESLAAKLHSKVNTSITPEERNSYWSAMRKQGSSVIASIDYNSRTLQRMSSFFDRNEMNLNSFLLGEWLKGL